MSNKSELRDRTKPIQKAVEEDRYEDAICIAIGELRISKKNNDEEAIKVFLAAIHGILKLLEIEFRPTQS